MVIDTGYAPRKHQMMIHANLKRFNVLVCHRRFGKTVLCINQLIHECLRNQREMPRYHYVAPLFKQAKRAAWDYLKHYTRSIDGVKYYEQELRCDLPGNRRIELLGSDNYDSVRGIYSDGVVMDEYAQMPPGMWREVMRPALADRKGMAIFIGTPKGRNAFFDQYNRALEPDRGWYAGMFKASETNIIDDAELRDASEEMTDDEYAQEWECSFEAAIPGSYFGKAMLKADEDGRIGKVPFDEALPVETWWDLGIGDPTGIWFMQRLGGGELHAIDYYEEKGEGLAHYATVLDNWQRENNAIFSRHIWPHDGAARDLSTGGKREDKFRDLGFDVEVQARESFEEGIEAARRAIATCHFDEKNCAFGIEALRQYRMEYDDKRKVLAKNALHDWSSHAASAFRIGAMSAGPYHSHFAPIEYPKNHPSHGVV